MEKYIFNNPEEVTKELAHKIVLLANEAVDDRGSFSIALSGGNSPKKLYELLASYPLNDDFPWEDTFFFFGDERYVPIDDPENNSHMARQAMLNKMEVNDHNILVVNTLLSPADAARDYARQIKEHFGSEQIRLDLILLGLGDDAHTASLFPHTSVLDESDAMVKEVELVENEIWRITLTKTFINQARHIIFFTFGEKKAHAVKNVLEGDKNEHQFPAQLIHPTDGSLSWYMDKAAASLL